MKRARFTLDPAFSIGEVDRKLYGSFLEHLGRAVYTGVYEPGHPSANEQGFRQDVLDLVRELRVPIVRYPGGNFVSNYDWKDGIGPKNERPSRLDLAWHSIESNEVGVNEFAAWCELAETELMLAVNLGTHGVEAARDLVEYCNFSGGTYWSDLRASHGVKEPHEIRIWCLGNEMDAPWQIEHKTANEYGRLAAETAKAMRRVDESIELVACGSSNSEMPTFGEWEATVLEHTYEDVDYISLHHYYEDVEGDLDSFLASALSMDEFIGSVIATCDYVKAKKRSRKRLNLAFDEWNVWERTKFKRGPRWPWSKAPRLLEDVYSLADALVVGSLLITLLNHADRIKIACQAQLVNAIAPIMTEPGGPAWRQTIFYPFAHASRFGRGTVLRVEPESPLYDTAAFGPTPLLEATATLDEDRRELTVFAVNRDHQDSLALTGDLRAFSGYRVEEHLILTDQDAYASNTLEDPDRVRPRSKSDAKEVNGTLEVELPPLSWNVIRLTHHRGTGM
jgi:alpha-N-arabinofuranosidase